MNERLSFLTRAAAALPMLAIRRPRAVVAGGLLLVLLAAPGVLRLKLRTDGHALVSDDAPAVVYDREIRQQFGIEDQLVVLVRAPGPQGIYNPDTLRLVKELSADLARIPGIRTNVISSLATEPSFRYRPGTIQFQAFLEAPRETPESLDQLRDDLRRIRLYTGTIVSADGQSTCILLGAPEGRDRTAVYAAVREIIAAKGPRREEIHVVGAPAAESLLGLHILEDLGVPRAWLGRYTSVSGEPPPWKWPRSVYEFRRLIAQRAGLVPVAMGVMALVFYLSFRRLMATLLPLMEVGACLVFVFGLMGWLGVPVYLTTAVMPIILTAMGVSDEVYIFTRYTRLAREQAGAAQAALVAQTMAELWRPVVNMAVTTAVGFLSFALSSVKPVQSFGVFTSVGILFCLLWSLTVVPALLVLLPSRWLMPRRWRQQPRLAQPERSRFGRFACWTVRWRHAVLAALAVLLALTPAGLQRLRVQDSWIDGFAPESEFFRGTTLVNQQFHGAHLLLVTLDAGHRAWKGEFAWVATNTFSLVLPRTNGLDAAVLKESWLMLQGNPKWSSGPFPRELPAPEWRSWIKSATNDGHRILVEAPREMGFAFVVLQATNGEPVRYEIASSPFLRPETLHRIATFRQFIDQRRELAVGGVLGPSDYVATTRFMVRPHDETSRRIPEDPMQVRTAWDYYRIARGPARLRQALDTNYGLALLTVFMKDANFAATARLLDDLRAYEREQLAPYGIKLGFAGDVAVSQSLIQSIVSTQVRSLGGSLLGILLVTAWLGRSLRAGLYCVIPSALAVLMNFAVMGWAGIPLGVATSMFAGMTLGMGVDFAIHLLERFEIERALSADTDTAIARTMGMVGPAVLLNALGIALGFGVLVISQVPANARLGVLVVLGVVNCLIATLLALPVLLRLWPGERHDKNSPKEPAT